MATSERQHLEAISRHFDVEATRPPADLVGRDNESVARAAFERLAVSAGQTVLDIGCGHGFGVRWAAEVSHDVQAVGIDLSAEMIALARSGSTELANARFIHAPFPLPILKAKVFDSIFSVETFYYFRELQWALVSTIRLLKPGGLFGCVISYYHENSASHAWGDGTSFELNLLSATAWCDAMVDVGFEIVEQTRLKTAAGLEREEEWPRSEGRLFILARRPIDS